MRFAPAAAALVALSIATPAFATGGLVCRPVTGSGPALSLVIGHGVGLGIAGANLTENKRVLSTFGEKAPLRVGQSWIDSQILWLDLTDASATRHEAKLRARFNPKLRGRPALGTLTRGRRTWQVRCEEG